MPKSICFIGPDNYPVLNPEVTGHFFGGESIQQVILAKAFVKLGYEVSTIVYDYGQPQGEEIDGVTVWKTFDKDEGLPGVRFFYPRMTSIFSAMAKADADVYFQSCAGVYTGYAAAYCKLYKRQFVFRLASDSDCVPEELLIQYARDKKIYEYGLKRAHIVSAQSEYQQTLLKRHYNLDSVVVDMAVDEPSSVDVNVEPIDALWVANIRECKRPDVMLQLARRLPALNFVMIGGPMEEEAQLYTEVTELAKAASNVEFLGAVPYHQIGSFFRRARMFVNTSDIEGFPNTFLQAWVCGKPVVSFFDPDETIKQYKLGSAVSDLDAMAAAIPQLLGDEEAMERIDHDAKRYVEQKNGVQTIARIYRDMIEKC
ncbi:MAG: glycosyltransferase family 4 protein [Pseudomonadota bacterium]